MKQLDSPHKLWSMAGDLNYVIVGSVIKKVWLPTWYASRYKQGNRYHGQVHPGHLVGWYFSSVEPYGKSLLLKLENFGVGTRYIGCDLGQGRWLVKDKYAYITPWTDAIYMVFDLCHQDGYDYRLLFYDKKRLGKVEIREHIHQINLLNRYGPAIDSPYFTLDWMRFVFENGTKTNTAERPYYLKHMLLRQEYFAGVTNKMASEILFLANLDPKAYSKFLTQEQIERLYHAILVVFGTFSRVQKKHEFMIWGKLNCPVCESKVLMYKEANRRTYYCPACQSPDFKDPQPISEDFVKQVLIVSRTMEHVKTGAELYHEQLNNKRRQQVLLANVSKGKKQS